MNTLRFICCALILTATAAHAQKSNNWLVHLGFSHFSPNASLQSATSKEPMTNGALQGASVDTSGAGTLSLGVGYMLTDNFEAEFALGLPPKFNLDLNVPSGSHKQALSTTVLLPAMLVNYHFGSAADVLRPFMGVGISYDKFVKNGYNRADPVVSGLAGNSISLNSTWSPVFRLGASYRIDEKLSFDGGVVFIPVEVKGRVEGPGVGAGTAATDLSLRLKTTVFVVSTSYRF